VNKDARPQTQDQRHKDTLWEEGMGKSQSKDEKPEDKRRFGQGQQIKRNENIQLGITNVE
jgi:hypothetical protein